MGRPSKRGELLDAGVDVFHRRGYAAASVETITETAGVPKGALFNHFGSKEGFANEALRRYFERWRDGIGPIVANPKIDALKKLRLLVASMTDEAKKSSYSLGCLVGNFSAELSGQYQDIRFTISEIFREWAEPFETVIAEGQKAGELSTIIEPAQAARFIVNTLQGALLRCKVDHSSPPLVDLDEIVFGVLLSPGIVIQTATKPTRSARRRKRGG
jgi:TetR/AcrR family transcriptional regulator, transcriptional repressor for nem operon